MAQDYTSSWMEFAQRPYDEGGLGLAKHQAAGLVGNLQNESGAGITPWGVSGDNGTAQGSAQWRLERLDALKRMYPDTYQTPEAQQAFMRHELDTTHNAAYKAIQAATSPEAAARAFNKLYEVSADTTGNRAASARRVFGSDVLPDTPGQSTYLNAGKPRAVPALSPDNTMGPGALTDPGVAQPEDPWKRRGETLSSIGASLAGIVNPAQAAAIMQGINANHTDANNKRSLSLREKLVQAQLNRQNQGSWSSHVMPNGQVLQTNSVSGDTRVLDGTFGKGTEAPPSYGDTSKTGEEYLATVPEDKRGIVKMMAEGALPPGSQYKLGDPKTQALIAAANRYDPTFDATTWSGRVAGAKDWSTGGKSADIVKSLNQAIGHLSDLPDKMKALGNDTSPLWNSAKNAYETNVNGKEAVTNFKLNAHAVADELGKMFKGSGLSDREIKQWEAGLGENMSPEQQRGSIRTLKGLLEHSMGALEEKRRQAIGSRAAEKKGPLLDDAARDALAKLDEFANSKPESVPAAKPAAKDKRIPLDKIFF